MKLISDSSPLVGSRAKSANLIFHTFLVEAMPTKKTAPHLSDEELINLRHCIYSLYIQTVIQTAVQTVVKTVQTIQTARGGVSSIDPFLRGLYGLYSFYNGLYHGLYHGLYVQTVP